MRKETKWVEICKAGTWIDKRGNKVELTEKDLDNIVSGYDPKEREAPLVFGHPEENDPAFGWASKLRRVGEVLQAKFKDVSKDVRKLVADRHYKKVSLSLFPDKKTLRHVGLLGATQPAVPGLKNIRFEADENDIVIEFSNETENLPKQKIKEGQMGKEEELQNQLAEEKKKREAAEARAKKSDEEATQAKTELSSIQKEKRDSALETRIDDLVGKKIKAGDKAVIKQIALACDDNGMEIELSSGAGKKPVLDHLFDFLNSLPDLGLLSEFSAPNEDGNDGAGLDDLTQHV